MDEEEEIYREMNREDPFYMGNDAVSSEDHRKRSFQKYQDHVHTPEGEKTGKQQFMSLSKRDKVLAVLIWISIVVFLLMVFFS